VKAGGDIITSYVEKTVKAWPSEEPSWTRVVAEETVGVAGRAHGAS